MRRSVGMAVHVAIEAGHPKTRFLRAAVFRGVELLLREWRQQQAQAFELLGIENAIKQLVKIGRGYELSLGHVAQIWTRGQINWRGKFGHHMIRQVKVEVKTSEIAAGFLQRLVHRGARKNHSAPRMIWGRAWVESPR